MGPAASVHRNALKRDKCFKNDTILYYFPGRGLADQIRWLLAAAEVPYVQESVTTSETFVKMTESQLKFGQLPMLHIDEHNIVQAQAAIRYIARHADLAGKNSTEELQCDQITETVRHLMQYMIKFPALKGAGKILLSFQHF